METNKNEFYVVSVEDTIKYGIIKAAIIGRVRHWCQYNEKNNVQDRHHIDYWWSGFMSSKVLAEQLGMKQKTIEENLSVLLKNGVLIKGCFNKKKYDRTGWYRVNPNPPTQETLPRNTGNGNTVIQETLSVNTGNGNPVKQEMDLPQNGEPIPVSISVSKSVKTSVTPTVSTPVNPPVELTDTDIKELISVIKTINAPDDTSYWVECLIKGESIINSRKEQIRKHKSYFNKGTLLPKFLEQELEH